MESCRAGGWRSGARPHRLFPTFRPWPIAASRPAPGARRWRSARSRQVAPDRDVDDAAVVLKGAEHRATGSRRSLPHGDQAGRSESRPVRSLWAPLPGLGGEHYDLGGEPLAFQPLAKIDDAGCRTFAADPPSVTDTLRPETGPPDPLFLCPLPPYSVGKLSSDASKVENSVFSAPFEARNLWISHSRGFSPGEKFGQPSLSTE